MAIAVGPFLRNISHNGCLVCLFEFGATPSSHGNPVTGLVDCCAPAASGHAAAPPTRAMNLRRLMVPSNRGLNPTTLLNERIGPLLCVRSASADIGGARWYVACMPGPDVSGCSNRGRIKVGLTRSSRRRARAALPIRRGRVPSTSSIFLDCTTGRSAGSAPLRMFAGIYANVTETVGDICSVAG